MAGGSVKRLEAAEKIIEGLKNAYPDAKKINIDIHFEWEESSTMGQDDELCPKISIQIER